MLLKKYQLRILRELNEYLTVLRRARDEYESCANHRDEGVRRASRHIDFVKNAWKELFPERPFFEKKDGTGRRMPDVFIKVPTGGGKTLLAVHAVETVRRVYMHRDCGITLWIVPTQQIYAQTLRQFRDRAHPYRQWLEMGGRRVRVVERKTPLTHTMCATCHVVMVLMLPAANRENKAQLRMYRDSGAYQGFFPDPEDVAARRALQAAVPNLDCVGKEDGFEVAPYQFKNSLGNVLRLYRPLAVVDEGQKLLSDLSRETLAGFNPEFVLELSATPPPTANLLAGAGGRELLDEDMIKLDINLVNRENPDWKQTLFAAKVKRDELEREAEAHEQKGGRYIRPILLVQVENTGAKQRDGKKIHSEDAREYLMALCDVPSDQIVVKASELNELGDADLLSRDCPVRYIITQRALQEGWDCSFAYVLAVLSNLGAMNSLQQLVGRVLRQPYAVKTTIPALDQCYVFTNRANTGQVVRAIQKDLEGAGMGDVVGGVRTDMGEHAKRSAYRDTVAAQRFRKFAGRVYLPQFVVMEEGMPRLLEYRNDILQYLKWEDLRPLGLENLTLEHKRHDAREMQIRFTSGSEMETGAQRSIHLGMEADSVLMSQQLLDAVPNPWYSFEQSVAILAQVLRQEEARGEVDGLTAKQRVDLNFVYITEAAKRLLGAERDKMAREFFYRQMEAGKFKFMLLTSPKSACVIPKRIKVISGRTLTRADNTQLRRSLFEFVPEEDFNESERSVALYLDEQARLLWWYRNQVRDGYAIQGWRANRVYPDFVAARGDEDDGGGGKIDEVLVMELKGTHLSGSVDTLYKESLMKLCDEICRNAEAPRVCKWGDLSGEFDEHRFRFQLVREEEYKEVVSSLLT